MMKVFDEMTAPSVNGTSLVGYLEGFTFDNLVNVLGRPTFDEPSGDDKVQVEWVVEYDGEVYTVYDWKTYNREFTLNNLTEWNVGGKSKATTFIAELTRKLLRNEQAEIL